MPKLRLKFPQILGNSNRLQGRRCGIEAVVMLKKDKNFGVAKSVTVGAMLSTLRTKVTDPLTDL